MQASGECYALSVVSSSDKEYRKPTAFDAGMPNLDRWIPGGKTQSSDECAGDFPDGLPELITKTHTFGSLGEEFTAFYDDRF